MIIYDTARLYSSLRISEIKSKSLKIYLSEKALSSKGASELNPITQ